MDSGVPLEAAGLALPTGADGLSAGILLRAKRRLSVLVGVAVGMAAYLGAVVGLASLVS